jgi:hypothetical protein
MLFRSVARLNILPVALWSVAGFANCPKARAGHCLAGLAKSTGSTRQFAVTGTTSVLELPPFGGATALFKPLSVRPCAYVHTMELHSDEP